MAVADSESGGGRLWDERLGVWVGNAPPEEDGFNMPKRLVIFGYGSLCWKPEATLESFDSFPCYVEGWYVSLNQSFSFRCRRPAPPFSPNVSPQTFDRARLFAQRSMDHRGTPDSPGLVATLCEISSLEKLPGFDASLVPDRTLGRYYANN